MNTLAMAPIAKASPRFHARLAGIFEVLEGMTSSWGQVFILGRLVVFGDAAVTAANILGVNSQRWKEQAAESLRA